MCIRLSFCLGMYLSKMFNISTVVPCVGLVHTRELGGLMFDDESIGGLK